MKNCNICAKHNGSARRCWSFFILHSSFFILHFLVLTNSVSAQLAPELGYVFPVGGRAGSTVDVKLGGYDWTPDLQFFVHDRRVKLEVLGPPGELLIPPPPYWFGARGRLASIPLPRELPARLTLPADLPAGPIRWQVANANGASATGIFIVGAGPEVVEDESRKGPQTLPSLPVTVSGRLLKNEEIDSYRITATQTGPVTIELTARRLGANFHGALEVRDASGRLLGEIVNAEGEDPSLTFAATAGTIYQVNVRDIDHAGDRSYVYRLGVTPGPRILATLPASGRRGETCTVEVVGIGVATGRAEVERVTRTVTFPATGETFAYRLETPFGAASPWEFPLGDHGGVKKSSEDDPRARRLVLPAVVTADLGASGDDRYTIAATKGDVIHIAAQARRIASPLDPTLVVRGTDGKEIIRNDDLPGTTDAGLDFTAPADGAYQLVVSDQSGTRSAHGFYRLVVSKQTEDFALTTAAQRLSVPIGTKVPLTVKVTRIGAFKGPVALTFAGLPPGVSVPANLTIPADKAELAITLDAAADAAALASPVAITGTATVAGKPVARTVIAPSPRNLAPRSPEENESATLMVVTTLKPRIKGQPVDKDTGRKVPRGSTHPAEIVLERLEGYQGEIILKQAATQSYQVHGITGRDLIVPPGVTRAFYPCFMPEWLETGRTSRMGIAALVKVADPKGNVRWAVAPIQGFVTMHLEGSLLKIAHVGRELASRPGESIVIRVKLARSARLPEPVRLELRTPAEWSGLLKADSIVVPPGVEEIDFRVHFAADPRLTGDITFGIRGTAVQPGDLAVISETTVAVTLGTR